ncbi:hypothetical protein [Nitrosomonas nitrosa]|uniref:hypothetical protein n=1 Tax=Nitrosomonas nitrosa TaxID=52442 RepID=UPI0023F68B35|nr:hypothetical protein [Nitrosomonas nitrosa]MCO6434513.1 hypothetical protein [Nitrosomonas nitrosa]
MSKSAKVVRYGGIETRTNGDLKAEPIDIDWQYAECDAETGREIGKKRPEKIVGFDNRSRLFTGRELMLAAGLFLVIGVVLGTLFQ